MQKLAVSHECEVIVGITFNSDRCDYWYEKVRQALTCVQHPMKLVRASDKGQLASVSPTIIIAQECDELIAYLSGKPKRLRWVQFMSAGVDRTMSVLGAGKVPFRITNMRGIHADAMVEFWLACVLYFEKHISHFVACQQNRVWSRRSLGQIKGKRLLVCGAGAIGRRVGEVFITLGGRADGIARTQGPRTPLQNMFRLDQLEQIVGNYDYIFAALPLTTETRGVFSRRVFDRMRPEAIFVNIGRGEQVDNDALIAVLESGRLLGVALDAFEVEPLPPDSPLWNTPRLLITPHVSGLFPDGHDLGLDLVCRNMRAFLNNLPLESEVFPERGY